MIDLLNLEPTQISRNLKGKFFLLYGLPKIGKTTFISKMPKCLIFATEPGYNALQGAMVQPIVKWTDFKMALMQLKKPEVKEKFDFIAFDTIDLLAEACEKFICEQFDISNLGDVEYGKGHAAYRKEFSTALREIAFLGYGICFVSHSAEKKFKNEKGEEYIKLVPALTGRPYDIVNKMVDVIGYIKVTKVSPEINKDGFISELLLRGDDFFLAGSRFAYMPAKINFSYDNLVEAFYESVDRQVSQAGGATSEVFSEFYKEEVNRPYQEAIEEARKLWFEKVGSSEEKATKVAEIVEKICGRKMKLSDIPESQQDFLELIILEMKEL